MNVVGITKKNVMIFLFLGVLHMSIYYHFYMVPVFVLGEIIAFSMFVASIVKKRMIGRNELLVILLCIMPVFLLSIIQFFYLKELTILKASVHHFLYIIEALVITRLCTIEEFTSSLRWWGVINLVVIVIWAIGGTIDVLGDNPLVYGSLLLSYGGISFPFHMGTFDDDFIRCGGLFGHPNGFGLLSAVGFVGVYFSNVSMKEKIAWLLVFVLSFFIHESRSAVLFVVVYFVLYRLLNQKKSVKNLFVNFSLITVFMILFQKLAYIRDKTEMDITSGRIDLLEGIYQKFSSELEWNHLFGIGFGQAGNYVLTNFGRALPFDNSYLYMVVEQGYVGAVIFLMMLFIAYYYCYRITNIRFAIWFSFFMAFLVHAILESDFEGDKFVYVLTVLFYMIKNKKSDKDTEFG